MGKIYVPDLQNYKCFVVRDANTIRAYKEIPQRNTEIDYRDYFINSHYLYNDSTQSFGNYSTYLPVCLDNDVLTDSVYYRNDFDSILVIFFIMLLVLIYFPFKIVSRALGRWLKI